jgi:hypothetical protein
MTLLQQKNRIHCSPKKAVTHQRKDYLEQGAVEGRTCRGCATMPRLTREWREWFALAEDLHDEIYSAHSYQVGPSCILSQAQFQRELFTNGVVVSINKSRSVKEYSDRRLVSLTSPVARQNGIEAVPTQQECALSANTDIAGSRAMANSQL